MIPMCHRAVIFRGLWVILAGVFFTPLTSPGMTNFPAFEDFESYTNGTILNNINGWYSSANPYASVTTNTSHMSTNSGYVASQAVATNTVGSGSATRVWTDMWVKWSGSVTNPPLNANVASMFYFTTNGYVVVQDGATTNWIVLTNSIGNTTNGTKASTNFNRVTVIQNFSTKKWAIALNDVLLRENIGFINSGISSLSAMVVSNQTYLDNIVVSTTLPGQVNGLLTNSNPQLVGDQDSDGMPDAWEIRYFTVSTVARPGTDYDNDGRVDVAEYYRVTDPTDPNSFSACLNFRDGFEPPANGLVTGWWRGMTNSGSVYLQSSVAIEGSKALGISTGRMDIAIADTNTSTTNVWIQLYMKPSLVGSAPAVLGASQVAGFCIRTNGDLLAFSSEGWTNTATITKVPTNHWLGFAIHLDYLNTNWDLYVDTNGVYGMTMKRAHSTNLCFNASASSRTNLGHIIVTNNAATTGYVDAVAATFASTNVGNPFLTNLVTADRLAGRLNPASMPPYSYTNMGLLENTLSGEIGLDLRQALATNDKIQVYSNGMNVYKLDAAFTWQWESGAIITNLHINKAMGMWIQRFAGVDSVAFYPYSNMPTMIANVTIYGTNAVVNGWNQLASPFTDVRIPNGGGVNGYLLDNATVGDRMYIGSRRIYWNGSSWREGVSNATVELTPGQGFWYYHKGTGMVWTVAGY